MNNEDSIGLFSLVQTFGECLTKEHYLYYFAITVQEMDSIHAKVVMTSVNEIFVLKKKNDHTDTYNTNNRTVSRIESKVSGIGDVLIGFIGIGSELGWKI